MYDFEEILDQALDMLRRRGRVTYGALKRQFKLDDAYLEDLKNEIVVRGNNRRSMRVASVDLDWQTCGISPRAHA